MLPTTCPDCGEDLKPRARRCVCGWTAPAQQPSNVGGQPVPVSDPQYGWCEWRSGVDRCRYPGAVSLSTRGGTWYCIGHVHCSDPLIGGQIVDESVREWGNSPDYSAGPRVDAIKAKWRHDWNASGGAGRKGPSATPSANEQRQAITKAALAMKAPA